MRRLNILYALANVTIYPLAYYIIRYRRRLVHRNLVASFPEKDAKEIRSLEKQFYHHLADMTAEIIYGRHCSEEEWRERVVFKNVDKVVEDAQQKGGVIFMLGHLGNWEWIAEIGRRLAPYGITQCNVYRRLKNRRMDERMMRIRNAHLGICCEKNTLLRQMILHRQSGKIYTYGMLSDQKPSPNNAHYWTEFLNRDTSFLSGSETLGKKFDYPVYYAWIECPKRGYYIIDIQCIGENPKESYEYEITERFARKLEQNIRLNPALWLWSHNRWKWNRKGELNRH